VNLKGSKPDALARRGEGASPERAASATIRYAESLADGRSGATIDLYGHCSDLRLEEFKRNTHRRTIL
jgi:hypothetical protein